MTDTAEPIKILLEERCEYIPKGSKPLIIPTIESYLSQLPGWDVSLDYKTLSKTFSFKNYYQVMAFINAVAWLAHREDHHPEICFGYNEARITLTTHAANGITLNDLILAAKIDQLLAE